MLSGSLGAPFGDIGTIFAFFINFIKIYHKKSVIVSFAKKAYLHIFGTYIFKSNKKNYSEIFQIYRISFIQIVEIPIRIKIFWPMGIPLILLKYHSPKICR